MHAIVQVHRTGHPLGCFRVINFLDINDEHVSAGSAIGIASVLGLNEEGKLHPKHRFGRRGEARTKGNTVLRRSVGEKSEAHLVHRPSFVVDVDTNLRFHRTEILELRRKALDL